MFGTLTILVIILAVIITAQNITKTSTPSQAPNDSSTIISPTLTPTLSPTPTNTPSSDNQPVPNFKYPNSTIISQNGSETIYESTENPKKITDWYKDKIKSMKMNVTTFVQTSTNGNVFNKLVGANGEKQVKVEISKQNNNALVKIVVVTD